MGSISTKKLQENNLFFYSVDNIVKPYLKYACCLCRSIGAPSISYRFRTCIRTNSLRSSWHFSPKHCTPSALNESHRRQTTPRAVFSRRVAAWPVFRIVMQIGGFLSTGVCFWKKTQYLHQQLEVTISAKECLLQTSNLKKTTYIFLHSDFYHHHHPFPDCDIHAWYFWYFIFILPHPIPTKSVLLMFGSQKTASEFNTFFKDHQPQHP